MSSIDLSIKTAPKKICPACGNSGLTIFYRVNGTPVICAAVFESISEALGVPRGDIALGHCENCGYICNTAFDPALLEDAGSYEDQQGFSPTFQNYAEDLAEDLINRYDLHDKLVVEIGCGKGDFLSLLIRKGAGRGVGIDPKSEKYGKRIKDENIIFKNEDYAQTHGEICPDFIFCRHTLEHIHNPLKFITTVRQSIRKGDKPPIFFEVPDVTRILDEVAFWDIYYEHCGYYNSRALEGIFSRIGFEITEVTRTYQKQYLILHAVPVNSEGSKKCIDSECSALEKKRISNFTKEMKLEVERWNKLFSLSAIENKRVVIWGSGSKCVGFMNLLSNCDIVEYIVDINPYRQGKYIPGFGRKIVEPEFLKKYNPDNIIVMNSIYREEIRACLKKMDLQPELSCL